MDRKIVDLPCMFGPLVSDWHINPLGRSAGDGVTGAGQVLYGAQPRWEATLNLAGFRRDQVLTWRAIKAQMRGRVNILRVCICDMYRTSWRSIGLHDPNEGDGIPHDDDTLHDDDTGYEQELTLVAPVTFEAGAEEIIVDAAPILDALQPGQWFSHDDWPYQVTGVFQEDGGLTRYTFEPPLRRDIPEGEEITTKATALMAFVGDMEGRLSLDMGKRGTTTINLVEWTNRP